MSIGALDAVSAYGRAAGIARHTTATAATEASGANDPGFGSMIERLVSTTAGAMRKAETASARQVAGKGDLIDVATAMSAAETALETVVAVRDRVVGAYGDIMRMQI